MTATREHMPFKGHRTCAQWINPEGIFAEEIAEHGNVRRAAKAAGKNATWGGKQFALMCERMGEQTA